MRSVYASVDDIDLWIGGLLEPKVPGSIVGLTFRDIVADQFSRLKKGDKYFFDHDPSVNPGHFTRGNAAIMFLSVTDQITFAEQLQELRKASMARLVCDNSDAIMMARQAVNAFKKPGVAG